MVGQTLGPLRFIPGKNRGRYPYCNSVYIEEAGILIDPASDRQILSELRDTHAVREIWLSHWHEDHFRHLDLFEDVPFRISERDHPPLTGIETFLDWYAMENPEYRAFWAAMVRDQFHFRARKPAGFFQDREIIDLGSLTVEVVPTPGHTPGHLAFYFRESRILFMGDYDLTPFGPWYGDLLSDIDQTIESIHRLKAIPAEIRLTGHETGLFSGSVEKLWDDYENVIYERNRKLLNLLASPKTLDEVVSAWIVYGRPREPEAFFEFGERAIMKKHLDRLVKKGRIDQNREKFQIKN
ncbi:MAG: MBL fold metallo-hydrolase [Deltaproteobacteria bacterium]|nr:MBL fold metallo-hydrolase [Deltaproteobacteria bacterium]